MGHICFKPPKILAGEQGVYPAEISTWAGIRTLASSMTTAPTYDRMKYDSEKTDCLMQLVLSLSQQKTINSGLTEAALQKEARQHRCHGPQPKEARHCR